MWISFLANQNPSINSSNYKKIRKFAAARGIFSQCISAESGNGPKGSKLWDLHSKGKGNIINKSLMPNIWRQLVNKSGELCWWSYIENYAPTLRDKCVMFIGIDVHHAKIEGDMERKSQSQSLAGMVAVIVLPNSSSWRTYCAVTPMKARYETLGKEVELRRSPQPEQVPKEVRKTELGGPNVPAKRPLKEFVENAMRSYGVQPQTIIVYRDGVSHSQLEDVKLHEAAQLKEACPNANVIFSVIQKQNHCRFIVHTKEGLLANPPPGSYFDEARVVPPESLSEDFADFYLIPTFNGMSTAKPVHYCIITGSRVLPLEHFQSLTFLMCHLYPNWASTIRVPFVTQAASKLAYLLGSAADPEISPKLSRSYFYL